MPELAEVEYYRKQWEPGIGGEVVRVLTHPAARIYRDIPASAVENGLAGRTFLASHAHGKQMIFSFSGGAWLGLHLGMSGELRTAPGGHAPAKHEHLVLDLGDQSLVFSDYRMFGCLGLDLVNDNEPPAWWRELPPPPLDPRFTKKRLKEFVRRFPRRLSRPCSSINGVSPASATGWLMRSAGSCASRRRRFRVHSMRRGSTRSGKKPAAFPARRCASSALTGVISPMPG